MKVLPKTASTDLDVERRGFLRTGAMTVAALAVGGVAGIASAGVQAGKGASILPAARSHPHVVVYDSRFADSAAFASRARKLGLFARDLEHGDVTRLWYDDLYHRWQTGPAPIAGLTTHDALFVLERFGHDAGLRLAFSAEHRFGKGRVDHRIEGPALLVQQAPKLQQCGADWSADMALFISRCPEAPGERLMAVASSRVPVADASATSNLYSWVLVPKRRQA